MLAAAFWTAYKGNCNVLPSFRERFSRELPISSLSLIARHKGKACHPTWIYAWMDSYERSLGDSGGVAYLLIQVDMVGVVDASRGLRKKCQEIYSIEEPTHYIHHTYLIGIRKRSSLEWVESAKQSHSSSAPISRFRKTQGGSRSSYPRPSIPGRCDRSGVSMRRKQAKPRALQ